MPITLGAKRSNMRKTIKPKSKIKTRGESYALAKTAARRVINAQFEKHYYDGQQVNFPVDWNSSIYKLTATSQGDTDSTRSGDRITIKSLQLRGTLTVADTHNIMRIIIFQYLGDDAVAVPTSGQVLEAPYYGTYNHVNSPYAKDFVGYKTIVLWDSTYVLNQDNQAKQFQIMLTAANFRKKAKPYIQYQGGTSNGVGNIYLMAVSDSGAATHPSLSFASRLRYIDN